MNKSILSRVTALALVLLLGIGLAACATPEATTSPAAATAATSNAGDPATAPAQDDGPMVPYAEPITITWAVQTSAVQQFFNDDTYDNNLWSRKIKEDLNIDVKVAFSADNSTDAYRNKMNAVLASGDLPDIIRWDDRTFFNQAHEAGYLADITDVYASHGSEGLKNYQVKYPESFEGASFDGRLHGFPYMADNFHQATYLWIRDDWMANTNSTAPTTVSEMVELARKFTFEDPDGDGQHNTYGLALNKELVLSNYGTLLGLVDAYGMPGYGAQGAFYRGDDGKITYPYIQPAMKDVLSLVRDMYTEGMIDPEFVVKDVANMETDIGTGKLGMMYHMSWGTWHPFNITYQADGVITRPYPIPTVDGIDYKVGINSNMTGDVFMLNANCKNPEAFIKILNLYNQTCIEGTNAEDFNTYWANEQYRLTPAYVGIPTPELFADEIFAALKKGSGDELPANLQQVYGYVVDFESGANTDSNAYGTWGQMFDRGSMAIAQQDYEGHLVTSIMASQRPAIWLQNSAVLKSMMETAFTDIITGNKDLDSFDAFVQNWLSAGGQQTLDELEALYPEA